MDKRRGCGDPIADSNVAVIIPCYNEALTIGRVVQDFHRVLPNAQIYVFDNDSSDATAAEAKAAGAVLRHEARRGKGNVIRRMFGDVEADIYVMVDGDATYDALAAPEMVRLMLTRRLDMVIGTRHDAQGRGPFRPGHRFGNWLLTSLVQFLFESVFEDMLSGYRVFSRRFVKSFPAASSGFEIEAELSVHALQLKLPTAEFATTYFERPAGSSSKLRTYKDGIRILRMILYLLRDVRPALFFSSIAGLLLIAALILAYPVVITYYQTGLVPRLPTAVLSTGLIMLAALSYACGLILDSVANGRVELKRLAYLALGAFR